MIFKESTFQSRNSVYRCCSFVLFLLNFFCFRKENKCCAYVRLVIHVKCDANHFESSQIFRSSSSRNSMFDLMFNDIRRENTRTSKRTKRNGAVGMRMEINARTFLFLISPKKQNIEYEAANTHTATKRTGLRSLIWSEQLKCWIHEILDPIQTKKSTKQNRRNRNRNQQPSPDGI